MKRFNDWIDSLPESIWIGLLLLMVIGFEFVVMGGLQ